MTPGANLAAVTEASTIFAVVTEPSASFVLVIAPVVTVGLGYVPVRSPPAVPLTGSEVGITPGASFAAVIDPSCTLEVLMASSVILVLDTEPSASFVLFIVPAPTVGLG